MVILLKSATCLLKALQTNKNLINKKCLQNMFTRFSTKLDFITTKIMLKIFNELLDVPMDYECLLIACQKGLNMIITKCLNIKNCTNTRMFLGNM